MKAILFLFAAAALMTACHSNEERPAPAAALNDEMIAGEKYAAAVNLDQQPDTMKTSVARKTKQTISESDIEIEYHSPGVRGRTIWGGLVPYGQVWVTGAHGATRISFTTDMSFGNTTVPSGTYAIFTIPGKAKWVFILNKNFDQHLADDYKQEQDVLRLDIDPGILKDTVQRLTYEIKAHGEGTGSINILWETIKLSVPFNALHSATHSMPVTAKKLTGIKVYGERDPVCYMPITAGITDTANYHKKTYGFCSAECKRLFVAEPESYLAKEIK